LPGYAGRKLTTLAWKSPFREYKNAFLREDAQKEKADSDILFYGKKDRIFKEFIPLTWSYYADIKIKFPAVNNGFADIGHLCRSTNQEQELFIS
jgi:hypothetical protein